VLGKATRSRLASWGRRPKRVENASAARGGRATELRRVRRSKSDTEATRSARAHPWENDFPCRECLAQNRFHDGGSLGPIKAARKHWVGSDSSFTPLPPPPPTLAAQASQSVATRPSASTVSSCCLSLSIIRIPVDGLDLLISIPWWTARFLHPLQQQQLIDGKLLPSPPFPCRSSLMARFLHPLQLQQLIDGKLLPSPPFPCRNSLTARFLNPLQLQHLIDDKLLPSPPFPCHSSLTASSSPAADHRRQAR
jgi:hypothetical protein